MKKILFSLMVAVLFLSGCNKQFKVTLNLDNADGQTVYLCKDVDGNDVEVDQTVFNGNQAVLKADCDDPQTCYIIKFEPGQDCGSFPFFTENQNTTITGDKDAFDQWVVKGCATMEIYNAYRAELQPIEDNLMALFHESEDAYMAGDTILASDLFAQVEDGMEAYEEFRFNYLKNQPDNYLVHFMVLQQVDDLGYEKVKELADGFTTESVYRQRINDYLAEQAKLEVGAPFVDFTLKTAEGEEVNLETVIGSNRVVLVDFWASWCGPCRGENPYVKAAYEKYHAVGFEIVGVSVDRDEAAWLKAVADDGMNWIQVRDADNAVAMEYMIQYIPSNFLYDANGVMIAKGLRGEALEAKLAEVLQ